MASKKRARPRKRHQQLELPRLDKNGQRRGGKRAGAGRKPKGKRAGSPHRRRSEVDARHPQHVTLRVDKAVGWLRKRHAYRAVRRALAVAIERHVDFRIVHFSVQGNHIHLLCEADDKDALARGVQGFEISAARHINNETGRQRGRVFSDRYHAESIDSVRQARHALSYVLNNWRRHEQDSGRDSLFDGRIDPYSSAVWFAGWKERTVPVYVPPDYEAPRVSAPQTWLLAEGWKRGSPISVWEIPGPRR